ncbi:MAG: hypothetical protein HYX74_09615 [Acidobacteria bacterium]|nr:hypothetical protein [Acidobacteriota bacterium]
MCACGLLSEGKEISSLQFTANFDGGGRTVAEAGVGASAAGTRFSIPVLYRNGSADTGIAFVKVSPQPAALTLALRNGAGSTIDTHEISLFPGHHLPRFATEFFPVVVNQGEFTGVGIVTPFGTVSPDRVDIEATDARGLKSAKGSKAF